MQGVGAITFEGCRETRYVAVVGLRDLETDETCDCLDEHQATIDERRESATFEFNLVDGVAVKG